MNKFAGYILVAALFTIVGVAIGFRSKEPILAKCASVAANIASAKSADVRETPDGVSKFTSQLLECAELPESVSDKAINDARVALKDLIAKVQKSGEITYASVYYRDLNNGPWFGINEADKFFPASLLKLPLAMSLYDRAEIDTGLLSREVIFKEDPEVSSQLQPFAGSEKLVDGKKYTVQYLLDLMLRESDNNAANTLAQIAGMKVIDDVYHNLGLDLPQPGQDYRIDTHKYASFFRILYNATYADKVASEKILQTLSDATFTEGLVSGTPKDVIVSHKFGTRRVDDTTVQLHDCGIIYAAQRPYILCIMTQGNDFNTLARFIKDASWAVYTKVILDKS